MFERSRFWKANNLRQFSWCEAGQRPARREQLFPGISIAQYDEPPAKFDPLHERRKSHRVGRQIAAKLAIGGRNDDDIRRVVTKPACGKIRRARHLHNLSSRLPGVDFTIWKSLMQPERN